MKRYICGFLRPALLGACSLLPLSAAGAESAGGIVLWYLHHEAGTEPYRVRYIVTRDYLRTDAGDDREGFVLLDRRLKQIYNVVPANRSILQINGNGPMPAAPQELALEVQESRDAEAPALGGKAALLIELRAEGQLCHSALVAPGLLDEARRAMGDFQRVLAVQQQRTLTHTPAELRTPCFLANSLYATDFHLGTGVPLAQWNDRGDRRELLEYATDVELDGSLFELPEIFAITPAPGS